MKNIKNIENRLLEIEKQINNYTVDEILKNNLLRFFNLIDEEQSKISLETLKVKYRNENFNELRVEIEYFERSIKDIKLNFDKYLWVYNNLLLEEESKKVFIDMLYAKTFMSSADIENAYTDDIIYFDENLVGKLNNEVYIDCGGYVGDTVLQFISQCPDYSKIYIYEPLDELARKCKNKLSYFIHEGNVVLRNYAVYSDNKDLRFKVGCGNGDSTVVENGELIIHAVKLDDELRDEISFIKMDIEGSEKEAIVGAKLHIKNNTPTMAICIYHLEDDFWKIPKLIYEINENYIFKIRQHSQDSYSETVLYCIPKGRMDIKTTNFNNIVSNEIIAKRSEMVLKSVRIWSQEERNNVIGEMKARKWYISQLRNYKSDSINKDMIISDLQNWVNQLEESKNWLVEQWDEQKKINEQQNDYVKKLLEDKTWIELQYNSEKENNKNFNEYYDKLLNDKYWIETQWNLEKEALKEQKEFTEKLLADKEWIEAQWNSLKKENDENVKACQLYEQEIQLLKNNLTKVNYKYERIRNDNIIKKIIKFKKYDV